MLDRGGMRSDILPAGARTINRQTGGDLSNYVPRMRSLRFCACVVDRQKPSAAFEGKGERDPILLKSPFPPYQHEYYVIILLHIAPMPPDMRRIASW